MSKYRSPEERKATLMDAFNTVRLQWAVAEASRCLMCDDPPCEKGCLSGVGIKRFVKALKTRNIRSAVRIIREANFLVASCGRICPQAELCEGRCSATDLAEPIAIGELQRFVGEMALSKKMSPKYPEIVSEGKAAVVGGGPAGLSCAFYLRMKGIKADLFERHDFLGGVMMCGIPSYRLPKDILLGEIGSIGEEGANIIREEITDLSSLLDRYEAVFVGCGLGPPRNLGIPGEDLDGVMQAEDLLLSVNVRDERPKFSGTTVVLGGGNTAMDSAGMAVRLGSDRVIVAYRRSDMEMPAWMADREFVGEEGVEFVFLLSPSEILGEDGRVRGIRFQKTELGEPDSSGRRRPVPIEGAFEDLECSRVILAVGNGAGEAWKGPDIRMKDGRPEVDPVTMESSIPGLYFGGDLLSGGGTVVGAVADGRRAAASIEKRLSS